MPAYRLGPGGAQAAGWLEFGWQAMRLDILVSCMFRTCTAANAQERYNLRRAAKPDFVRTCVAVVSTFQDTVELPR